MKTRFLFLAGKLTFLVLGFTAPISAETRVVTDSSPLHEKADYFLRDLLNKHWFDGLYVSIVPAAPPGTKLPHTIAQPGNVIHAGVWTGRYLAGVGYEYAITRDKRCASAAAKSCARSGSSRR